MGRLHKLDLQRRLGGLGVVKVEPLVRIDAHRARRCVARLGFEQDRAQLDGASEGYAHDELLVGVALAALRHQWKVVIAHTPRSLLIADPTVG